MAFNISQMRSELRVHLGNIDVGDLDNDAADLLINRSWWQVQNSLNFEELKASRVITTSIGVNSYPIVPAVDQESIRSLSYSDVNGQNVPIFPQDLEEYVAAYSSDTNLRGAPEKYIREGDNIIIWPDPDDVYSITLYYLATLADWNDANPTISVPQSSHEIVLFGAVWRGWGRLGDINRMNSWQNTQVSLISGYVPSTAKDENAMQFARLVPYRSKYP